LIKFPKTQKNNFLLFFFAVICIYLALYFVSTRSESAIESEGYFQLVENASLPILLADQKQQFSLQIGALIRSTPIAQVRIFGTNGELLFRVQNTVSSNKTSGFTTLSKPLLFEGTEEALLEVDIRSNKKTDTWLTKLWLAIPAAVTGLAFVAIATFLQRHAPPRDADAAASGKNALSVNAPSQTEITSSFHDHLTNNAHLILATRILLPANSFDAPSELLTERLDQLSETICGMAKIYGAEPISVAANSLIFVLEGAINKQLAHQATMLCWGLTQIANEQPQQKDLQLSVQSYVIDPTNLTAQSKTQLAYWTELDTFCTSGNAAEAYLSKPVDKLINPESFELTTGKNKLLLITSASDAIKKLWRNQRLQLDKKNEH